METQKTITEKLDLVKKIHNSIDGWTLINEAVAVNIPNVDNGWHCAAIKKEGDRWYKIIINWDFDDCEYPDELEADSYDWEDNYFFKDNDKEELEENEAKELIETAYNNLPSYLK